MSELDPDDFDDVVEDREPTTPAPSPYTPEDETTPQDEVPDA